MLDGRKQILSPFTGRKKRKAWNKTREKYMPVKRRQNLAETDRGLYYKEECLKEFLDGKGAFCNGNESDNNNEFIMKIMNSSSYRRVLPIVATNSLTNF